MRYGDISNGLFGFNSPGAAFRHDLNQFALRPSAIWATLLAILVIWSWLSRIERFSWQSLPNPFGVPWLFRQTWKQSLKLFRLVAGCGLDLLRFPLFFWSGALHHIRQVYISVFPPSTRKLSSSLLDWSFLFLSQIVLSLSQNFFSTWLLNYRERKIG